MEKTIDETKQGTALQQPGRLDNRRKLYIESYGCQMNFSDSEIVASILAQEGFNTTQQMEEADLVLVNTCSIRDKAEQTVRKRSNSYPLSACHGNRRPQGHSCPYRGHELLLVQEDFLHSQRAEAQS